MNQDYPDCLKFIFTTINKPLGLIILEYLYEPIKLVENDSENNLAIFSYLCKNIDNWPYKYIQTEKHATYILQLVCCCAATTTTKYPFDIFQNLYDNLMNIANIEQIAINLASNSHNYEKIEYILRTQPTKITRNVINAAIIHSQFDIANLLFKHNIYPTHEVQFISIVKDNLAAIRWLYFAKLLHKFDKNRIYKVIKKHNRTHIQEWLLRVRF